MDLGLSGRRCIVTGASRGIGLEVARGLAAEGARVLLVGRDETALEAAADEIRAAAAGAGAPGGRASDAASIVGGRGGRASHEPRVATFAGDIGDPATCEAIVAACVERFGGVDVLVNNAGYSRKVSLAELTEDDWEIQWQLNVRGPDRLMRAVAPLMAAGSWGRIVNVTSSAGKRPSPRNPAYSVTKSAQLALSRQYADAWASRGVLVNAVAPGPTGTDLWLGDGGIADQEAAAAGTDRATALRAAGGRLPIGRLGEPREIADAIVFLCSERASNVSGVALSVDGGAVPSIV